MAVTSDKAQIVIGFDGLTTGDPPYILNLVIDSIARTVRSKASGAVAANWEFNIGISNIATADNFKSMILANTSNYTLATAPVGAPAECTVDADSWGNQWNFGSPTISTTGLGLSIVSQRDNIVASIVITAVVTDNLCAGASTGAINISVAGGASPFTYAWTDGPNTEDRTGLVAGNYEVEVTDSLGNKKTKSNIIVTAPQALDVTAVITDATGGGSNGEIDVSVSGGTAPYTYAWDDGPATTQDRTGLAAGTYTVTVTDDNGCTSIVPFVVADGASAIVITPTITHVLCNGGADGDISIVASGGTSPYTYVWRDPAGDVIPGATGVSITDFVAGSYEVTVSDNVGSVKKADIVITEPDAISIVAVVDGNDITLTVTGGTSPYTYLWDTTETTKDITVVNEGDYVVVVTDDNGCTKQATVTVPKFIFFWTENPIELSVVEDGTPASKPNLSFVCEVWIEDTYLSGTYTKVIDLEQPADANGATIFDVQDVVHAYLEATLPTYNENTISLATGHFRRFYLKYAEKYGTPPVEDTFTQQSTFYAILGGLSDLEFGAGTFMDTYLAATKPFFTWEPIEKEVFAETQLYLHYLVNAFSTPAIELHVKNYYTDDTTHELQILSIINTPKRFEVYRIPAGHNQLALDTINPAKTIVKYEVWMEDNADTVISEVRTYVLAVRPTFSRMFIYLNSLGQWSTLIAEGAARGSAGINSTEIQRKLESGYAYTDTEVEVLKKTGQARLAIFGGYFNNEDAAHLQDFAISRQVYEVTNGRFEPVRIDYNPKINDEASNYVTLEFTVLPPVLKKYTPQL